MHVFWCQNAAYLQTLHSVQVYPLLNIRCLTSPGKTGHLYQTWNLSKLMTFSVNIQFMLEISLGLTSIGATWLLTISTWWLSKHALLSSWNYMQTLMLIFSLSQERRRQIPLLQFLCWVSKHVCAQQEKYSKIPIEDLSHFFKVCQHKAVKMWMKEGKLRGWHLAQERFHCLMQKYPQVMRTIEKDSSTRKSLLTLWEDWVWYVVAIMQQSHFKLFRLLHANRLHHKLPLRPSPSRSWRTIRCDYHCSFSRSCSCYFHDQRDSNPSQELMTARTNNIILTIITTQELIFVTLTSQILNMAITSIMTIHGIKGTHINMPLLLANNGEILLL